MNDLDVVASVLGTALSAAALMGLGVRFVLMPYLRDHLIRPVDEVHRQVTENHHSNDVPTLPDRIDDLQQEVTALARVLEGHLESGDRWLDSITHRLTILEDRVQHHHP